VAFEPEIGHVIRYDFLWKAEQDAGREHGVKERPCAVVLLSQVRDDGSRLVVVCPITHVPPRSARQAVEIPRKVARHLGLDDQRSWIGTNTVNTFTWEQARIPYGVSQAPDGQWEYGTLPYALRRQVLDQLRANAREQSVERVSRDENSRPGR
jgi:hypothetical protein